MNLGIVKITLGLLVGLIISSQIYIPKAFAEVVRDPIVMRSPVINNAQLLIAAQNGDLQRVRSLISQGADVNVRDQQGWTPLLWAAMNGHTDIVRVLLVSGANPNTRNKYEWTPLMWAAGQGYTEIVRSLISFGARINAQDRNGWTAMMWAVDGKQAEVVAILAAKN